MDWNGLTDPNGMTGMEHRTGIATSKPKEFKRGVGRSTAFDGFIVLTAPLK